MLIFMGPCTGWDKLLTFKSKTIKESYYYNNYLMLSNNLNDLELNSYYYPALDSFDTY